MRRWFHLFMRKKMNPMSATYSREKKQLWASIYFLLAWNGTGMVIYYLLKESYPKTGDEIESKGKYYSKLLDSDNIQCFHVEGLTLVKKYYVGSADNNMNSDEKISEENMIE